MRRPIAALFTIASSCLALFPLISACSSSSSPSEAITANDAGGTSNDGSNAIDSSPAVDGAGLPDTGSPAADAGPATISVFASFDRSMGQMPEGLWEVSPDAVDFIGTTGSPITGFAPTGGLVTL